jgi:hypothetical protein
MACLLGIFVQCLYELILDINHWYRLTGRAAEGEGNSVGTGLVGACIDPHGYMATLFGKFPFLKTLFADSGLSRTEICESACKSSAASQH